MSKDNLHERGLAMEEAFFHEVDKGLLEKLKAQSEADENREELSSATGITDNSVLDKLLEQGITSNTLACVGLIPLVFVAWADGKMESRERDAILRAARDTGMSDDHSSMAILTSWLNKHPPVELLGTWKDYVAAMRGILDDAAMQQIKSSVVGRAHKVAESAGGFLGIVNTIDPAERDILHQLDSAFE